MSIFSAFDQRCRPLREAQAKPPAGVQLPTYWVFPAFDGEFADQADLATFHHSIYRKDGWRPHVLLWDRKRKSRNTLS